MSGELYNFEVVQDEYLKFLSKSKSLIDNNEKYGLYGFLDDLHYFWHGWIDSIEFEIESISKNEECFLLMGGAPFLRVESDEHLYFKALGNKHFLFDPFLKIEKVLRSDSGNMNESIRGFYKNAFESTVRTLTNFNKEICVIPITKMNNCIDDNISAAVYESFYKILSSVFEKNIPNKDVFCQMFDSYEEIESKISKPFLKRITFNGFDEYKLTLRNRMENFKRDNYGKNKIEPSVSESEFFHDNLFALLNQVIDIKATCVVLGMKPYIRLDNVVSNFFLIGNLKNDEHVNEMLKYVVYSKVLESFDLSNIAGDCFSEFTKVMKEIKLLDKIIQYCSSNNINILNGGMNDIELFIKQELLKIPSLKDI